jgi:L-seryl-tRNA(Ser) seleniumtransferase
VTEPDDTHSGGLRDLPSVDRVLSELIDVPRQLAKPVVRSVIDATRDRVTGGERAPSLADVVAEVRALLARQQRDLLGAVINATGVIVHTNLGRVPLGPNQLDAVNRIASSYSNLEYDLVVGRRGTRYAHTRRLLRNLTGAESAVVVNNNAAAVLLVLAALCSPRDVLVSRGELIEIGGEFRIPDVMSASGARLVEVGTTNRTHLVDYERAISADTAAILKVHPSNYRVVGFTASVAPRDLGRLARGRGVLFIHDVGSGFVADADTAPWSAMEPRVEDALSEGADLVTFSGDKLLGGPQAGVIVGRDELVAKIERHPLMRALRVDKMTLAALQATLEMYLSDRAHELPVWRMALADPAHLEKRAETVASAISSELAASGLKAEPVATSSVAGGGSLPGTELPSWAIALVHGERSADQIQRALRECSVPVIGRVEDDRVLLDLRTVPERRDHELVELVIAALR